MQTHNSFALLDEIDANRGCPESATSVTVGVRTGRAGHLGSVGAGSHCGTFGGSGSPGCRPLVSTQVVAGANLALGRGSAAGQTINAQGPERRVGDHDLHPWLQPRLRRGIERQPASHQPDRPLGGAMSRRIACLRSAPALLALVRLSAAAETLRCQSVNGNLNCAGSAGVSCQTVNGRTVCASGRGDVVQSFGAGVPPDMSADEDDGTDEPVRRVPPHHSSSGWHQRADGLTADGE